MDPFEAQLRGLPWRTPSSELRERLFPPEEIPVVRGLWITRIPLAWAAVNVVAIGGVAYTLRPAAEAPNIAAHSDLIPVEIASTQHFFDLSSQTNDFWPGPITLTVRPFAILIALSMFIPAISQADDQPVRYAFQVFQVNGGFTQKTSLKRSI